MNVQITRPIRLDGFETVPALFWHRVTTRPDKVALREKDRGIWKAYTWGQYGEAAKAIGSGLIALGLQPGERAAILSDNNKEWLFCDLGVLCAAGVSTGIYPTDSPAQVEYLINDCDAKYLFVEDEEQLDKILAVRERTPGLRKIVVFDMEGLRGFSDPQVISLEELIMLGRARGRSFILPSPSRSRRARRSAGSPTRRRSASAPRPAPTRSTASRSHSPCASRALPPTGWCSRTSA